MRGPARTSRSASPGEVHRGGPGKRPESPDQRRPEELSVGRSCSLARGEERRSEAIEFAKGER